MAKNPGVSIEAAVKPPRAAAAGRQPHVPPPVSGRRCAARRLAADDAGDAAAKLAAESKIVGEGSAVLGGALPVGDAGQ